MLCGDKPPPGPSSSAMQIWGRQAAQHGNGNNFLQKHCNCRNDREQWTGFSFYPARLSHLYAIASSAIIHSKIHFRSKKYQCQSVFPRCFHIQRHPFHRSHSSFNQVHHREAALGRYDTLISRCRLSPTSSANWYGPTVSLRKPHISNNRQPQLPPHRQQ